MAREREDRIKHYHMGVAFREEQARAEALRASVKRHWAKKFLSLPDWAESWLAAASFERLERVDEATWDASSPDEALAAAGVVRVTGSGER
jgi:hypothetical protein